jgi:dihydroorotate dehydrogenase electron transfer subunit
MLQIRARITYNKKIQGNYFHLGLFAPGITRQAQPGQFVNIRINNAYEPLLRRPFSIHQVRGKTIEIVYEVLGEGTQILSQRKKGELLDVIGPLGNGFSYELRATSYEQSILVAGGMGVAPLVFLAEKLAEAKSQKPKVKTLVLVGAKTKSQILCEKEFKSFGCVVKIATDDGSRGFKGKVTELLRDILVSSFKPQASSKNITKPVACSLQPLVAIYACGPKPMLKEIAMLSRKYNIPSQVSLEEHMACGIGACLGCVVNTKEGYKRVCKEGPVFNADEIIW